MQQLGTSHLLQLPQHPNQFLHVVTVERTEVAYVHSLEDVLLVRDGTLQGVAQADKPLTAVVFQHAVTLHPSGRLEAYLIIGLVGAHAEQILLHATYRPVYRHVVVIQDNQHVIGRRRCVVEALKSQAATHRSVTDDGHYLPRSSFLAPRILRCHRHTKCGRDAVGGMTADEGVVLALLGRGEGTKAAQLTVGTETVTTTGQDLMAVGLMAHIPYDAVIRGIIDIMKGYCQLYHTKARSQVAGVHGEFFHDEMSQLVTELWQLVNLQLAQVIGGLYLIE